MDIIYCGTMNPKDPVTIKKSKKGMWFTSRYKTSFLPFDDIESVLHIYDKNYVDSADSEKEEFSFPLTTEHELYIKGIIITPDPIFHIYHTYRTFYFRFDMNYFASYYCLLYSLGLYPELVKDILILSVQLNLLHHDRKKIHFPFIFGDEHVKKFELVAIKKLPKDAFLCCLFP